MSNDLAILTQAEQMLATVAHADDALKLANMAEAARVYARKAELGFAASNHATTIKILALKRMAELVDEGQARGEIATRADNQHVLSRDMHPATLEDLGISRQRLHIARKLSDWEEEDIRELARVATENEREYSLGEALRQIRDEHRAERVAENHTHVANAPDIHSLCGGHFSAVVIDPPWDWGDEGDQDQLGRARPTYATMPYAELAALPLPDICDRDAHLYLWITNRSLPKGFSLLEAWGFRYITALTWCKPHFGMGNYFRGQTEHVLFGVRGSLPLRRKDVGTWFAAARPAGHSSKPSELAALVESCSPGPYLEMFARAPRDGWTVWGAEA